MTERFHIQDIDAGRLRAAADQLIQDLKALLQDRAEVFEVGSTAVPGVIGKGDVDILVRTDAARFDAVREALDAGYPRNPVQMSNEVYQGYSVPSDLDVAIQLTVADGPYDFFLPFLDALRADPTLVEAYNALKRRFDGANMGAYREAKGAFIEAVLRGARPEP